MRAAGDEPASTALGGADFLTLDARQADVVERLAFAVPLFNTLNGTLVSLRPSDFVV